MNMKYQHLRALVAIAEQGSINGAARFLCVSQPAITKTMRELETEVGVSLLMRNSWGVTLTEQGQKLLERARLIVREFERAEEDMLQLQGVKAGRLLIGVTPLAGLWILPQAFIRFRAAMPNVKIDFLELNSMQILENLRNGYLDFALAAAQDVPVDTFITCSELLVFSTSFAVRRGSSLMRSTSFAQLQRAEWLHSDVSDNYPHYVCNLFARHGLPPPRLTRCTSNLLLTTLLMEIDAVVPMSQFALRGGIVDGRLEELELPESPPELRLSLMIREGAILTGAADYFIHCIRDISNQKAYQIAGDERPQIS